MTDSQLREMPPSALPALAQPRLVRWQVVCLLMLLACLLAPLLVRACAGLSGRLMADDFCHLQTLRSRGWLQVQRDWYLGWTGRFGSNLLVATAAALAPLLSRLLPALALLSWLASLVWALRPMGLDSLPVLVLSALILHTTVDSAPAIIQSFYWMAGLCNYLPPLILATALAGALLRADGRSRFPPWLALVGALAFAAAGFSEMATATLIAAVCVALTLALLDRTVANRRIVLLCALLAALAGLAVEWAAPGNQVRQALLPPHPAWSSLPIITARAIWDLVRGMVQKHWLNLASLAMAAAVLAGVAPGRSLALISTRWLVQAILGLPLVTSCVMAAGFVATSYALAGYVPARSLVIPQYALICGLAAWAYCLGTVVGRSRRPALRHDAVWQGVLALAVVLLAVSASGSLQRALAERRALAAYATEWDARDRLIRQAHAEGLTRIAIPPLSSVAGLDEAGADPEHWVNACMSDHYHVRLVTQAPAPTPAPHLLADMSPIDGRLGNAAQVLGCSLDKDRVRVGETLTVTVLWRPLEVTEKPQTVFVHLYDATGQLVAQWDGYPLQGNYPTATWVYDAPFADRYGLAVSETAATGNAQIVIGLYDLSSMVRQPAHGVDADAQRGWIHLGRATISP